MKRLLQRRYSFLLLASLVLAACSKYQPFTVGTYNGHALQDQQWEVALPYTSGKALVIEEVSSDGLLVCEQKVHFFTKSFHVVRIPFGSDGQPQMPIYRRLPHGDSCEVLAGGQVMVSEKKFGKKSITILNAMTLVPLLSADLPLQWGGEISLNGQKQSDDTLISYHTEIKIDQYTWSDSTYNHSMPYIGWAKYDVHLIDLTKYGVRSFANLDGQKLPRLDAMTHLASFQHAKEEREAWWSEKKVLERLRENEQKSEEGLLDEYLYTINDVYLLHDATVLIIELENIVGKRVYYSLDLRQESPLPEWNVAGNLVKQYPDELSLIERHLPKKQRSQDVVVSGITYKPEYTGLFLNNIVMIGRKKSSSNDDYAREHMAIGIAAESLLTSSLKESWRYPFHHSYRIGRIITDSVHETAYIVDIATDETFNVVGLAARDGRQIPGFPANIQMHHDWSNDLNSFTLNIVGTMVDFIQQLIFLHNQQKNSIICADLYLSP